MLSFSLFGNDPDDQPPSLSEVWRYMGAFRWLLLVFAFIVVIPRLLNLYVGALWFDSLNYSQVFWFEWRTKVLLFVVFFLLTFFLLRGAFTLLQRLFEPYALGGLINRFDGQPLRLAPEMFMRPMAWAVSILWSFISAASMTTRWELWALFFNQSGATDRDPIFGKSFSFYLFSWPVWQMLASWLMSITVIIFLATAVWALLGYISRLARATQDKVRRLTYFTTSLALAAVFATQAWRTYLGRFSALWQNNDNFTGVGYVQANIALPAQAILAGLLVLCALLMLWNGLRLRSLRLLIGCVVVPMLFSFGAGLVGNYVSNFVVKPNQLELESPYIKHTLAGTRRALGLDRIVSHDLPVDGSTEAIQAATRNGEDANIQALDNIRLWDWRALQATLAQTQALRPYYEFPDVDVDRYTINGRLRQVMIAARELDTSRLPETSRNWVNERLIYTHGYGIVMNTASEFTPEGRPRFIVSEMPLKSTAPEIQVTRPEIYFGQETSGHVYVKTRQPEFNFPQGGQDSHSTYEGNGGIPLGGFFRRTALAWTLGDLSKIPFSNAVTPDTQVLLHRQIQQRVAQIAPFLQFDVDPYVIVSDEGRLVWMLDAYTTSLYHPYSAHHRLGNSWANYMRNSVKVVVDAYEGTVDFYVFEPEDPIIQSWRNIYPTLFKDAAEMPADLRAHVRYPETLFRAQSDAYSLYHTDDPSVFFSRNDLWSVARLVDVDSAAQAQTMPPGVPAPGAPRATAARQPMSPGQSPQRGVYDGFIEPYFLLTQLPHASGGAGQEEFVLSLPFTPVGRPSNLSGWLAARSDGENYGSMALYEIAESRNISAPQQILARITQDGELAEQITLWNQQKSSVLWGNLLLLPIGRGVLYVQPIFLQSVSSPLPELRLVVLATQDRLFYASTYEEALRQLLGDETDRSTTPGGSTAVDTPADPQATDAPDAPATPSPTPTTPTTERERLIQQAARDLADYQSLTSKGQYGEAGQKLESLRNNLDALSKTP